MAFTIDSIFDRLQERLADDTRPNLLRHTHRISTRQFVEQGDDIVPLPENAKPLPQGSVDLFSGQYLLVTTDGTTVFLEHPTGDFVYDYSAKFAQSDDLEKACDIILHFVEHGKLP